MNTSTRLRQSRFSSRTGAALLVAVILGAAIALALGTFIYIANSELRMANRTGQMTMVNNVAEAGFEEVLSALNTATANTAAHPTMDPLTDSLNPLNNGTKWTNSDYDGVSSANGDRRKIFTNYISTSQQVTSSVSVLLLSTSTAKHYYAVAKAVSTAANGQVLEKYVWGAIHRKPLAPPGMYARYKLDFKGTSVAVDSYRSSLGVYGASISPSYGGYNNQNIFSYGIVASVSSTVNVGQADIYGNVATGGTDPASTVGNTGIIGDWGDAKGTIDTTQTATNFTAQFDLVTPSGLAVGIPKYASDLKDAMGNPIYTLGDSSTTNTTPWTYYIKASDIDGTMLYTVQGPVRIIIQPETSGSYNGSDGKLAFSGSGGLEVKYLPQLFTLNSGGIPTLNDPDVPSLQLWTRGDLSISGKGLVNDPVTGTASGSTAGIPLAVQIYGYAADNGSTTTASQSFDFSGNQAISAMIYAPNANVTLGGGGSDDIDMMGTLVAKNVTLNGKVKFHVDEDLANAENGKFGVRAWRQLLTPSQRTGAEIGRSYAFGL